MSRPSVADTEGEYPESGTQQGPQTDLDGLSRVRGVGVQ